MDPLYFIRDVKPDEYDSLRNDREGIVREAKVTLSKSSFSKVNDIPVQIKYSPSRSAIGIYVGIDERDHVSDAEEKLGRSVKQTLIERIDRLRNADIVDWMD